MLDDLDDDPVFARVRAARPQPPAALTAAILARLPARRRPRAPLALGVAVAVLTAVVLTLLRRDATDPNLAVPPVEPPRHAMLVPDAGGGGGGGPDAAAAQGPDWTDLRALLTHWHATHGPALRACLRRRDRIDIYVSQFVDRAGTHVTTGGISGDSLMSDKEAACVLDVSQRLEIPPLPPSLLQITLTMKLGRDAMSREPAYGDWNDPARAAEALLDANATRLGRCLRPGQLSFDIQASITATSRGARVWMGYPKLHGRPAPATLPYDDACLRRTSRGIKASLARPVSFMLVRHRLTKQN